MSATHCLAIYLKLDCGVSNIPVPIAPKKKFTASSTVKQVSFYVRALLDVERHDPEKKKYLVSFSQFLGIVLLESIDANPSLSPCRSGVAETRGSPCHAGVALV